MLIKIIAMEVTMEDILMPKYDARPVAPPMKNDEKKTHRQLRHSPTTLAPEAFFTDNCGTAHVYHYIDRILVRIRNPWVIRQNMQKSRKMKTSAQKGRKLKQNNNPIRIAI